MFKAVREIGRKQYENPYVHDDKGRHVTNPKQIHDIVKEHFQKHFYKQEENVVNTFVGEPKPMNNPITTEEVTKGAKKLNNNRAADKSNLTGEMVKYGPSKLHEEIRDVYNQSLQKHEKIDVGDGLLAPLPKPNKIKGPTKHLRPVILLPILRKILSNILLNRTNEKIDNYLSHSQSAYRNSRSTSDIVWTHRWMAARIQMKKESYYIVGIDMSSAFDTIRRNKLIEILETFFDEDEMRITRLLLSDTKLEIKMRGTETESFTSNIGSPQGDGSSGKFFDIYFEYALKKVRDKLELHKPNEQITLNNNTITELTLPEEAIYTDDADFMTEILQKKIRIQNDVKDVLEKDNLLMKQKQR